MAYELKHRELNDYVCLVVRIWLISQSADMNWKG